MALDIKILPALTDNYIFLLTCPQTGYVSVIDPGEAAPVLKATDRLDSILLTHHHYDHVDGVPTLVKKFDCPVFENLPEGQQISVGQSTGQVLETPGHTANHISFYFEEDKALFCGDTLFVGGCGRVFDSTPEQLFHSLQKLKHLPPETRVYCAHEYTASNLRFACDQKPGNSVFKAHLLDVEAQRAKNQPTVPSTIEDELNSNIFLQMDTVEEFTALRRKKDN